MPFPQPLVPFAVAAFVLATVLWLVEVRRWRDLSRRYHAPKGPVREAIHTFPAASLSLRRDGAPPLAYFGHCITLEVAETGLYLRVWRILDRRHPPLLIPWVRMERFEVERRLLQTVLTITVQGARTRVRLFGEPARVVADAARRNDVREMGRPGPPSSRPRGFPRPAASAIFRAPDATHAAQTEQAERWPSR